VAGTATISITGAITGVPAGVKTVGPFTVSNTASGGSITDQTLTAGTNTVSVPVGGTYKGVIILPPSGNTNALTLRGVGGDTGVGLHLTDPTVLGISTSVTSFVINAGASTLTEFLWY